MYECWKNVPERIRVETAVAFSQGEISNGWKLYGLQYCCPFGYAFIKQGIPDHGTPPSYTIFSILDHLKQYADLSTIMQFVRDNDNGQITDYYQALGVEHCRR